MRVCLPTEKQGAATKPVKYIVSRRYVSWLTLGRADERVGQTSSQGQSRSPIKHNAEHDQNDPACALAIHSIGWHDLRWVRDA